MLKEKLTNQQQHEILNALFGFNVVDISETKDEHYIVYDEEGYEFYGFNENLKFDFTTLEGIFAYQSYKAKNQGFEDCQYQVRKLLGI